MRKKRCGLAGAMLLTAGLTLIAAGCGDGDSPSGETARTPPATAGEDTAPKGKGGNAGDPREEQYRRLLKDSPPVGRVNSAYALVEDGRVDAGKKAELLLDALKDEIESPTSEPGPAKSYLSATEWTRSQYTRALSELGGEGLEEIRRAARDEDGEVRERALLALGYAGGSDAVPGLRGLLRESSAGEVRAAAAWILGEMGIREALPELEAALADTYQATLTRHGETGGFFPVREQALGALEKLGLEVIEDGDGVLRLRNP